MPRLLDIGGAGGLVALYRVAMNYLLSVILLLLSH